ncbi:hypothetical protein VIBNIMADA3020_p0142 [Vibrio nigripulchritudo MADA3020]|nr:hypothetical protein VIBNIMADA3020_p0142 [Vibrio nigripulchritudo MADA3020]
MNGRWIGYNQTVTGAKSAIEANKRQPMKDILEKLRHKERIFFEYQDIGCFDFLTKCYMIHDKDVFELIAFIKENQDTVGIEVLALLCDIKRTEMKRISDSFLRKNSSDASHVKKVLYEHHHYLEISNTLNAKSLSDYILTGIRKAFVNRLNYRLVRWDPSECKSTLYYEYESYKNICRYLLDNYNEQCPTEM